MVHFFTKMGKMPDLGFGTLCKDGLCPKLDKNPAKPKLDPQNVLNAFLYGVVEYWNLQFLAKISPKIAFYIARGYYITAIYIF